MTTRRLLNLPFVVSLLLAATLASAQSATEQSPAPITLSHPIESAQLAFLKDFAGQPANALLKDKRFKLLRKALIPRTEYHYGRDMPLDDAIGLALDGSKLPIDLREGRYLLLAGNNGPYLRGRAMLWFDLSQGAALGAFFFAPTNGEPSPTLTVFSRQLAATGLGLSQFPEAFQFDLVRWTASSGIPAVSPRYFIPDNGRKYVLEHDQDYCWSAGNAAPPPNPVLCLQRNADAADADMNAAYFMQQTHNAANATAWMLGPDQVAWIGVRERTCGAALDCRIRITHERTRIFLGHPIPPPRAHGR